MYVINYLLIANFEKNVIATSPMNFFIKIKKIKDNSVVNVTANKKCVGKDTDAFNHYTDYYRQRMTTLKDESDGLLLTPAKLTPHNHR